LLAKGAGSRRKPRAENSGYWMSYSDMMAGLLLMFVLLLFLSFNRYVKLQEAKESELAEKEVQLKAQEQEIAASQTALEQYEQELLSIRYALNTQRVVLDEKEMELGQKDTQLAANREELEQSLAQLILQQARIEEQERLLALTQEEVQAAQAQLDAYSNELQNREIMLSAKDAELLLEQLRVTDLETLLNYQREQLETQAVRIEALVGVRARIIAQLRDAFVREGLNVAVDGTGAITLDSTVFFDTNMDRLKQDGRELLARLLPIYFRTLMSPQNAEFVAEIIVEGHTDSVGSYEHNLDLSQRRAQAVVNYCMSPEFDGLSAQEKNRLRTMITANGRSQSQLIYDAEGREDRAASRRVEIKFRLKDAEMIESMSRILAEIGD